ncbi:class I SAM-dependent methyltransferase [Halioglobus maricola]|uniref:Class I SAM-dependent methyltransferase n=1 Tax=Halioglobus maricola TaxID=2601894 RepID=A0A5P9NQ19_9GAMM|nr:class I SAM-dependent methyltransferase [Halioglobus maricola]QFU77394.1 class I SAM-dependent methyltransferase [Halioglobus maricola]
MSKLEVPTELQRGGRVGQLDNNLESSRWLLDRIARLSGREDLADAAVLDMGCGNKFTQAILREEIPIGSYSGIDVYRELIEYLQRSVDDPRCSYQHVDIHNAMYNPEGHPLASLEGLALAEGHFDIICLFSVFTHLAPHDYPAMLKLLRPYIKPDGVLVFSLFINEVAENGQGYISGIAEQLTRGMTPEQKASPPPPFVDMDPKQPLKWAIYSREYAHELLADTGWRMRSLELPVDPYVQHHFVCEPV